MKNNSILQPKRILCGLGAVALLGTASCAYTERYTTDGYSGSIPDTEMRHDYVYYPDHNVYYNRGANNFRTYEGNRWVTHTTPRNVSRQQVLASDSVSIEQYGTPERHYTEYVEPNLRSGSRSLGPVSTSAADEVRTISSPSNRILR